MPFTLIVFLFLSCAFSLGYLEAIFFQKDRELNIFLYTLLFNTTSVLTRAASFMKELNGHLRLDIFHVR